MHSRGPNGATTTHRVSLAAARYDDREYPAAHDGVRSLATKVPYPSAVSARPSTPEGPMLRGPGDPV